MQPRIIIIGFGNPGRVDDGLGPALAHRVEALGLEGVSTHSAYQLQVEDAALVAENDIVIFADASVERETAFSFRPVKPDPQATFTTHSLRPGAVLALAEDCFKAKPRAWMIGIRGHDFNRYEEGLSEAANRDLEEAIAFLLPLISAPDFDTCEQAGQTLVVAAGERFSDD